MDNPFFQENLDMSSATDGTIPEIPGMAREPMPWQRAAVAYFIDNGSIIHGCAPGVGKSGAALMGIEHEGHYPCLIVCPASIKAKWARDEVGAVLPGRSVRVCDTASDLLDATEDYVICNYEQAVSVCDAIEREYSSIVIDEGHMAKNANSKRFAALLPLCQAADSVQILTGTPVVNKGSDILPLLRLIGKENYVSVNWSDIDKGIGLDDLYAQLRGNGCMVRRTKQQVMADVAEPIRTVLSVQGSGPEWDEYVRIEQDFIAWLAERAAEVSLSSGASFEEAEDAVSKAVLKANRCEALVKLSALRAAAGRVKTEQVSELAKTAVAAGQQPIVFCVTKAAMNMVAGQLASPIINGETPVELRQTIVDSYQTGKLDAVVASYKAAGTGLTMTRGSVTIMAELPWTPMDLDQSESRQWRLGQKGIVNVHIPLLADSIDTRLKEILDRKAVVSQAILDGGGNIVKEDVLAALISSYTQP